MKLPYQAQFQPTVELSLQFNVVVSKERKGKFGRGDEVLISPVAGSGERWVTLEKVKPLRP